MLGSWGPEQNTVGSWGPDKKQMGSWGPEKSRLGSWGPEGEGLGSWRPEEKKVLSGGPDKNQVGPWGTASTGLPKRVGSRTRGPRGRAGVEGSREKQGWVPGQGSRQKTSRVVCTCRGHESTRIVVATKEVGPVGKGSGVPT